MLDSEDIKALEDRFDMRYKLLKDCNNEMDAMRKENTQIVSDVSSIKTSVDSLKWLARTTLGAVIGALVAGVIAIIKFVA